MSTAKIWLAPAMASLLIAARPTPPQPIGAARSKGNRRRVHRRAPSWIGRLLKLTACAKLADRGGEAGWLEMDGYALIGGRS